MKAYKFFSEIINSKKTQEFDIKKRTKNSKNDKAIRFTSFIYQLGPQLKLKKKKKEKIKGGDKINVP